MRNGVAPVSRDTGNGYAHRVVVTGLGVVSPVGIGVDVYWDRILKGESGIDILTRLNPDDYPTRMGAEVKDFNPGDFMERRDARRMDRFTQYAVVAADMALADAGIGDNLLPRERLGVVIGTGIGGMETLDEQFRLMNEKGPDRVSPFFVPMMIANMAAGQISIRHDLRGPNSTLVTACAASAHAMGEAFRILQRGDADVMVTGGAEAAFVPLAFAGFCTMKAMSTWSGPPQGASRPFDLRRDGFVMGEGSGILVFERLDHALARGAKIYAEVLGFGMSADAHHITAPAPGGSGGARSMQLALADAGLEPEAIDYINAHGTGTPPGDISETEAIKSVFGEHAYKLAVSSTKSMIGHLLGAAGAVEAIACILAIRDNVVPPTINLDEQDPACDLDYVPWKARPMTVDRVLSNSFGFGGQNATLIFGRYRPEGGNDAGPGKAEGNSDA